MANRSDHLRRLLVRWVGDLVLTVLLIKAVVVLATDGYRVPGLSVAAAVSEPGSSWRAKPLSPPNQLSS